MPVHATEASIKLGRLVAEFRYDEGFRYLDHCGETLVALRNHNPKWVVVGATAMGTVMKQVESGFQLNFDADKVHVSSEVDAGTTEAVERCQKFALECSAIYEIVVGSLRVPNTTRVGTRSWFHAPSDSLEDADNFVCKMARSGLLDEIAKETHSAVRDASMSYVVEDRESGTRRRIELLAEAVGTADLPPLTGLPTQDWKGRIMISVDTYTRPEMGHYPNVGSFINDSYLASRRIATALFKWGRQQQTYVPQVAALISLEFPAACIAEPPACAVGEIRGAELRAS